jgi:hypothetical protein
MNDPAALRDKAVLCRKLATDALKSSRRGQSSHYLFRLAAQIDQEAAELEARFAGNKPTL